MNTYYANKVKTLADIFGVDDVVVHSDRIEVNHRLYPIIYDVVILLEEQHYTPFVRDALQRPGHQCPGSKLKRAEACSQDASASLSFEPGALAPGQTFSAEVQYSFGEEWQRYGEILPEHADEFSRYFDIVDLDRLTGKRVCDLGCGNGRWSYFLHDRCREIVLIDFSDAIFQARQNLIGADACLFFMGDLRTLPFRDDFADFLFCLGVLHHLPTPCLEEVRHLKRYAPELLIFLYYAFDNRPAHFRALLKISTALRLRLSNVHHPGFRKMCSLFGAYCLYLPMIWLGHLLRPFHASSYVPLYDFYHDKSLKRIQQDVYDRFFTSIEQRVSEEEILTLWDTFSDIIIAERLPYWHFLCRR